MTEVEYIVKKAKALGACKLLSDDATIEDLTNLIHHPQGQEFCHKKSFPTLKSLQRLKEDGYNGIYTDEGEMRSNRPKIAIAGNTDLHYVCDNVNQIFDIVLYHGARVTIEALNYAVVHVTRVGTCEVWFKNIDGTARMFE